MAKELNRTEELHRWQERYQRRNWQGRSRMLDEFCDQYGYDLLPQGKKTPEI